MPSYGYTMRVVPIDAHRTEMQYDVYRPTDATDEDFNATHEFFRQVEQEDKYLCVRIYLLDMIYTHLLVDGVSLRQTHRRTWSRACTSLARCTWCAPILISLYLDSIANNITAAARARCALLSEPHTRRPYEAPGARGEGGPQDIPGASRRRAEDEGRDFLQQGRVGVWGKEGAGLVNMALNLNLNLNLIYISGPRGYAAVLLGNLVRRWYA